MRWAGPLAAAAVVFAVMATVAATQEKREALVTRGEHAFRDQGCYGCHLVGKFGTAIGPNLSYVGAKYTEAYLTRWLRDPQEVRPAAHMPKLELTPEQIEALAAFLSAQR